MAEQKGSPTKKTIAPTPHKNEEKGSVELEMERLSKAIQAANDGNKDDNETLVKSLKSTLSTVITNIKSEDKVVRRQNLLALKQTRAQIATLEEGALSDKETVLLGIDRVIEAANHSTKALDVVTDKMGKTFFKSLPTAKGFMTAFIKNSNPLLQVALNVVDDVAGLITDSRKKADDDRKKNIEAEAKTLSSIEGVKKATEANTAIVKEEAAIQKAKRKSPSAKKGEGPVVSRLQKLNSATDIQTRLLQAIYEDLSGKSFDAVALIKKDSEMLAEFVEGMKEGIAQEGKAQGADPELIKGIQDGISQEAAPVIALMKQQQADEKAGLEKVTAAVKEQTLIVKKSEEDRKNKEFKQGVQKPVAGPNLSGGLFKKEEGGIAGMIKGFASSIGGFLSSIFAGVGGAFGGILKMFGKVGGLLKLAGKASGIFTIFLAVLDFFNGFNNADKILGKAEGALTLWDKISSGLGMVVEGFLSLFDFLGGFIGFDTGWSKGISTKVAKFFVSLGEVVADAFTAMWADLQEAGKFFKDAFDKYTSAEYWQKKVDDTLGFIKSIPDMIIDFVKSVARAQLSFLPDALRPAWLEKALAPSGAAAPASAPAPTVEAAPAPFKSTAQQLAGQAVPAQGRAGAANEIKEAENEIEVLRKKAEDRKAQQASVNSNSQNTVNANTTNYYPSPLKTRNDDDSIRGWNMA